MTENLALNVTGMKCGGCETNVKTALQKLNGVVSVHASFKDNRVEVAFDAAKVSVDSIKQAIKGAGFEVQ